MILTITPPAEPSSFDYALRRQSTASHDFTPSKPFDASSLSALNSYHTPRSHHRHLKYETYESHSDMTTHHRGLPPPSAMTLPDPTRPASALPSHHYQSHHSPYAQHATVRQDHSESYMAWRAEEEKLRQEEEKRKQEELKLRQREIEHQMLRDSLHGGIPPQLVPVIFAGIAGGPLSHTAFEFAQQALVQLLQQTAQQQQPPVPPLQHPQSMSARPLSSSRKDVGFQQPYLPSQPQQAAAAATAIAQQHTAYPSPAYASPRTSSRALYNSAQPSYAGPTSAPRNTAQTLSSLPRLSTNEAASLPSALSHQQGLVNQQESTQSPSISFHHWQPPATSISKDGRESSKTSPRNNSEQSSPRKRKAESQQPGRASPTFSTVSTVSNKSKRLSREAGRRASFDSALHTFDPIGRNNRSHGKRERSSSQEERSRRATPDRRKDGTPLPE